jgi:hypothetical protein
MKSFLLLLCAFPTIAFASGKSELPSSIRYLDFDQAQTTVFDSSLDKTFENSGFKTSVMNGSQNQGLAMEWLNRIYVSERRGMIFAKAGVQVVGEVEFKKVYQIRPGVFVSHLYSETKGTYVFYFTGTSESFAQGLTNSAAAALKIKGPQSAAWNLSLLPVAQAEEGINHFCESSPPTLSTIQKAVGMVKAGGKCIKDFANGMWQATGGMVASAWNAVWHPVQTYDKVVAELASLGNLFANFSESFGEMKQQIANLPSEVVSQIICELAGNIGAGAALTFLTVGGGGPAMTAAIAKAVSNVAAKTPNAGLRNSLNGIGTKMAEKAEIATKARNAQTSVGGRAAAEDALSAATKRHLVAREAFDKAERELGSLRAHTESLSVADKKKYLDQYQEVWREGLGKWKPLSSKVYVEGRVRFLGRNADDLRKDWAFSPELKKMLDNIVRESEELADLGGANSKYSAKELVARGQRMQEELEYVVREMKRVNTPIKVPPGGWAPDGAYEKFKSSQYDPVKLEMDRATENYAKAHSVVREMDEPAGSGKKVIPAAVTGIAVCQTVSKVRSGPSSLPTKGAPTSR